MAWNYNLNQTQPADTNNPSEGAAEMRDNVSAVWERLNNGASNDGDQFWPLAGSDVTTTDAYKHRQVTFVAPQANPASIDANNGILFTKDVTPPDAGADIAELCYMDDGSAVTQLTADGVILITAAAIAQADTTIVDDVYITHTGGVLTLKAGDADNGITGDRLNSTINKMVDNSTIEIAGSGTSKYLRAKVPAAGAGATVATFLPVCAVGSYTGNGTNQTITAFASGVRIRHIVIKAANNDSGVEAISTASGAITMFDWLHNEGTNKGGIELISGSEHQFKVTTVAGDRVNQNAVIYHFMAIGEWRAV